MAQRVTSFDVWVHYEGPDRRIAIDYTPRALDAQGQEERIKSLRTQMNKSAAELQPRLIQKLGRV